MFTNFHMTLKKAAERRNSGYSTGTGLSLALLQASPVAEKEWPGGVMTHILSMSIFSPLQEVSTSAKRVDGGETLHAARQMGRERRQCDVLQSLQFTNQHPETRSFGLIRMWQEI